MKHPKPWNYDPSTRDIRSAGGGFVCTVYCGDETAIEIVRAVNAHEALVGASRALEAMVRAFENGWPSHATESIGGLGHMPEESCNACRTMPAYLSAQQALTLAKETT